MLPPWLAGTILDIPASYEAQMFYGPQGDVATVAVHERSISCAWLSAAADEIRFVACQRGKKEAGLAVAGVLVAVLREALLRQNKLLLHAAAVRCSDGTGVLIQADSGGGKSTTALSMVRNGASMLSDDLIFLDGGNENIFSMTGFPEEMNLTDQTLAFFPELGSAKDWPGPPPPPSDWTESYSTKARVNLQTVYPHALWADKILLQAMYFVRVSKQGPLAKQLSPAETLGRLIKSYTFAVGQKMSPAMGGRLVELAHALPAYIIETGTDPVALGIWLNENSRTLAAGKGNKLG